VNAAVGVVTSSRCCSNSTQIKVDSTKGRIIQDADTTIGSGLFAVSEPTMAPAGFDLLRRPMVTATLNIGDSSSNTVNNNSSSGSSILLRAGERFEAAGSSKQT